MLEKLTTKKIFWLFTLALIAGATTIIINTFSLIVSSLIVVTYTLLLFTAQRQYYISLSIESKNSPYILGFLFTLIALLNLFLNFNMTGEGDFISFLVPQTGTALSTTIIGLVCRYFLLSYDPTQESQENIWRQATEELKENASAYKEAQKRLLMLVEDFVTTHREVLSHEQEASKQHLNFLNETTNSLKVISSELPIHLHSINNSLGSINEEYNEFLNISVPTLIKDLTKETSLQLQKLNNDFTRVAKTTYTKMTNGLEQLELKMQKYNNAFENALIKFPEIQKQLLEDSIIDIKKYQRAELTKFFDHFNLTIFKTEEIHQQLSKFNDLICKNSENLEKGLSESSTIIAHNLKKLSQEITNTSDSVNQSGNALTKQNKVFHDIFHDRLETLGTEIKQVDKIIGAFIEINKKRLN